MPMISDKNVVINTEGLRLLHKEDSGSGRYRIHLIYEDGKSFNVTFNGEAARDELFEKVKAALVG